MTPKQKSTRKNNRKEHGLPAIRVFKVILFAYSKWLNVDAVEASKEGCCYVDEVWDRRWRSEAWRAEDLMEVDASSEMLLCWSMMGVIATIWQGGVW